MAGVNQFFYGVNPKTNENLETQFHSATIEEVNLACELAEKAFEKYAQISADARHKFILRICELVEKNRQQLIAFFCQETGLPEDRAQGELNRSVLQFQQYSDAILNGVVFTERHDKADLTRIPFPKPNLHKTLFPVGPVVVFGASNFPFAYSTLGGDVASALAAGCPVIVKAHNMHPHTSSLSAELIRQAAEDTGMPEGVFSHLQDANFEVGKRLVTHDAIKAIGFTGSFVGGLALMKLAQNRKVPIPVFAEMGSVNPVFILPDILTNHLEIANKIADSVALNAGQFCTSPGFVFIPKTEEGKKLVNSLMTSFSEKNAQCMLHPGIKNRFEQRVKEHASFVNEIVPVKIEGNLITPGLSEMSMNTFLKEQNAQEELFGSYLTVVFYQNQEELARCIDQFSGQLTMSVFTEIELSAAFKFKLFQKAGRIILNGVPTGVEVSAAQQHGGPFPSSSNAHFTAVGSDAVLRFLRPVTVQYW